MGHSMSNLVHESNAHTVQRQAEVQCPPPHDVPLACPIKVITDATKLIKALDLA
jgi:hypothetical protein